MRGLFFSAITRASASPEEKRMKFTLMPVAFSNSSNMGRAQFSGEIGKALQVRDDLRTQPRDQLAEGRVGSRRRKELPNGRQIAVEIPSDKNGPRPGHYRLRRVSYFASTCRAVATRPSRTSWIPASAS